MAVKFSSIRRCTSCPFKLQGHSKTVRSSGYVLALTQRRVLTSDNQSITLRSFSLAEILKVSRFSFLFVSGVCFKPWNEYEGYCYLLGEEYVVYQDACQFCKNHSAELVDIQSRKENAFLTRHIPAFHLAYIGLRDPQIEGRYVCDRTGESINGSYSGWGPNEPNNAVDGEGDEDCVSMDMFGWWNDIACDCRARPYCKRGGCSQGWLLIQSQLCMYFVEISIGSTMQPLPKVKF